jgi:hypothetical protein
MVTKQTSGRSMHSDDMATIDSSRPIPGSAGDADLGQRKAPASPHRLLGSGASRKPSGCRPPTPCSTPPWHISSFTS